MDRSLSLLSADQSGVQQQGSVVAWGPVPLKTTEWGELARPRVLGSSWTRSFDTPSEITQKITQWGKKEGDVEHFHSLRPAGHQEVYRYASASRWGVYGVVGLHLGKKLKYKKKKTQYKSFFFIFYSVETGRYQASRPVR